MNDTVFNVPGKGSSIEIGLETNFVQYGPDILAPGRSVVVQGADGSFGTSIQRVWAKNVTASGFANFYQGPDFCP
jgi:hypothetical protein